MWRAVSIKAAGRDAVEQRLQIFHRTILTRLNTLFHSFITSSRYFELAKKRANVEAEVGEETEDEETYFEEVEMSSYLRSYKELGSIDTLYQMLQSHILTKQMDQIAKEAY